VLLCSDSPLLAELQTSLSLRSCTLIALNRVSCEPIEEVANTNQRPWSAVDYSAFWQPRQHCHKVQPNWPENAPSALAMTRACPRALTKGSLHCLCENQSRWLWQLEGTAGLWACASLLEYWALPHRVRIDRLIWGLFRYQIFPQISLCKKKIPHHIKISAHAWSTKYRWNQKLIAQFCCTLRGWT
jgi:hypothetical protein